MKKILFFIIGTMFICLFGNLTFAEELVFKEKIGYVDPDSGDKLLDREIDDEFVKETYLCSDGSYSWNVRYKWELLELQKFSKEKKLLCQSVKTCSYNERINGNSWIKKYRTSKNSDWVELQPGEVIVGNMDIGTLICHYYLIKTKYPERISEIPQDLLNKRKMKFSDVTPPKTFTKLQNAADKAEEKRIAESLAIEESIVDAELEAAVKKNKLEIAKKYVEDNFDFFIQREAEVSNFEVDEDIENAWNAYKAQNSAKVQAATKKVRNEWEERARKAGSK